MPPVRHLRMVLQYEGTDYCGFQRQAGHPTVQEALEEKLGETCGEPITVVAAGRTDSGVHASGQIVAFRTRGRILPKQLELALNWQAPEALGVRHVEEVDPRFHPQFDALRRTYRYHFWMGLPSPFMRRFVVAEPQLTDEAVARMQAAAGALVGKHDFAGFCAADHEAASTVRTVEYVNVSRRSECVTIEVTADGFLRRMVRCIAGTLLEIGLEKRDRETLARALQSGDRRDAGATARPQGLMLTRVEYADGYPPRSKNPIEELMALTG